MSFELRRCRRSLVSHSEVGRPRRGPGWTEPQLAAQLVGVLALSRSLSILASPLIRQMMRDPPSSEPAELPPAHAPLPGALSIPFTDTIAKIPGTT